MRTETQFEIEKMMVAYRKMSPLQQEILMRKTLQAYFTEVEFRQGTVMAKIRGEEMPANPNTFAPLDPHHFNDQEDM